MVQDTLQSTRSIWHIVNTGRGWPTQHTVELQAQWRGIGMKDVLIRVSFTLYE